MPTFNRLSESLEGEGEVEEEDVVEMTVARGTNVFHFG